jgi:phosphoribosyl-ATP pyrophosphohydrolase/phosphoribosyl-AMP cyclohydrolase
MSECKKIIPALFLVGENVVKDVKDLEKTGEDAIDLAKSYEENGADALLFFDLSKSDEDHENTIDLLRRLNRKIRIPVLAGGNIKRLEDVKKLIYAGSKRAILNFTKESSVELLEEASNRFGKERLAVSLPDFDTLYKYEKVISENASMLVFMEEPDIRSVAHTTTLPSIIITHRGDHDSLLDLLHNEAIEGISGMHINEMGEDLKVFRSLCEAQGLPMKMPEDIQDFAEFKIDENGLIPVIVQHYKSDEVLMLAYMNEESYYQTLKTRVMTYYSRSRKSLWVKGETSGHYQHVHSLSIDCDKDTLLAKVDQIGVACHTGNYSCFYTPVIESVDKEESIGKVLQEVIDTIEDRKENPKEGSYTNYLFDKGIDKILKKVGEEATEMVIAAKNPNPEEIKYEMADFLYHAMVLMVEKGVTWDEIANELIERE